MGYFLVFWSLFSYAGLGVCHKLAERKHCRTQPLATMLMFAAFLGMNVWVLMGTGYAIPARGLSVAFICGSIALCALVALQEALKYGKIATSWLIINLSSAIPTIGSVLIYNEPINFKKIGILALIAVAIVLVWLDRREDLKRSGETRVDEASVVPTSGLIEPSFKEEG